MKTLFAYYALMHFFVIPVDTIEGNYTCGVDMGGYYQLQSVFATNAYICEGSSSKEQIQVYKYHETGHFIYHNKLSQKQVKEWEELHKGKGFVSEYAKTNADEDFAETVAYYMSYGKLPGTLWKKQKFLRSIR